MNERCCNDGDNGELEGILDTVENMNMIVTGIGNREELLAKREGGVKDEANILNKRC